MDIKTRFQPGDTVLVLVGTKLEFRKIDSIKIEVANDLSISVGYWFKIGTEENWKFEFCNESICFASQKEFINQLNG